MAKRYTPEQSVFLAEHIRDRSFKDLTALFNKRFEAAYSEAQIRNACKNRKLRNGRPTGGEHPSMYTPEMVAFLAENIRGRRPHEITALFNERFGLEKTVRQIESACGNRGLYAGLDGRFKPGSVPFNKGMKGLQMGGKETQFKKGHLPHNYMPVGSERVNAYGNVDVKIADPNKWRSKASLVWEAAHGPIPARHVVVVADSNKQNVTLENLILLSRAELAVMNKRHLIGGSRDLTEAGRLVASVIRQGTARKKASVRRK